MTILFKDMWFVNTDSQHEVDKRATKKGYIFYTHKDTGKVYFPEIKYAKRVAKFIGCNPDQDVYHTSFEFVVI